MIQCTRAAAATLDQTRIEHGVPVEFGVRLFAAQSAEGEVGLGLEFRPEPLDGDEVAEQFGTRIMVAPEVADQLSDVTLDVIPDPSSNGDRRPQLVLRLPGGDMV